MRRERRPGRKHIRCAGQSAVKPCGRHELGVTTPAPTHDTRYSGGGASTPPPAAAGSASMVNLTAGSSCSAIAIPVRVCMVGSPHSIELLPLASAMKTMSWSCSLLSQRGMARHSVVAQPWSGCGWSGWGGNTSPSACAHTHHWSTAAPLRSSSSKSLTAIAATASAATPRSASALAPNKQPALVSATRTRLPPSPTARSGGSWMA